MTSIIKQKIRKDWAFTCAWETNWFSYLVVHKGFQTANDLVLTFRSHLSGW